MARRHFDWRLGLVVILATTIFVTAAFLLRRWERHSRPAPPAPAAQSVGH